MSLYSLTEEELILHHYAALVQHDLEAYRICASRDEAAWKTKFEDHLRQAMNYFEEAARGCQTPPRVHPLLLSLSKAWSASDTSPDIHSVSENDPRVIGNPYYILPSELPPLNSHIPGNSNKSPEHSAAKSTVHTASEPQGSSVEETGTAYRTSNTSAAPLQKGKQAIAENSEIQDLKKQIEVLNTKCAGYECIMESHQQLLLRLSHHLNIFDPTYEGIQYEYHLQ
ncbi:hypothetical protein EDB89DRAFT_1908021 [Lactarius sanguifluus]|nr:hypothetical protein EDB89DRAFT_1908021 [Lactarius sanguifluus]